MAVTDYSQRRHRDPDTEVRVNFEGQTCTGFIDARRRREDVWEALVIYTVDWAGCPHTRRGWFTYDGLALVEDSSAPA